MKPTFQTLSLITLLLLQTVMAAETNESFKLETHSFVFKNSDFQSVKLPDSAITNQRSVVFRSPSVAQFDRETLSLEGGRFGWNGGQLPPTQFRPIAIPAVNLIPGQPVSLLSVVPVQYFEKDANGTLQVREIPKDSPDAPHWRLTFTLKTRVGQRGDVGLLCEVDVASVGSRESLPGVTLPVGKPVIARFNEKLDLEVVPEEWSAFIVRAPNESNYSLLTLLKIGRAAKSADTGRSTKPMSAEEFSQFATFYYQQPQPEMISRAIESLGSNRFLNPQGRQDNRQFLRRVYTCVGFFAEIFGSRPDRVTEWQALIERKGQDRNVRTWLRTALKLSRSGSLLAPEREGVDSLEMADMFVGAFFASGNPAYLRKLVDRLESVGSGSNALSRAAAGSMMLLAYNAPHHPLVRQTLEEARTQAAPRTRELINDILTKNLDTLRKELRLAQFDEDASSYSRASGNHDPSDLSRSGPQPDYHGTGSDAQMFSPPPGVSTSTSTP
jgi:hypothetical protein